MNKNSHMKRLQIRLMLTFVGILFAISVLNSILDSVWEDVIAKRITGYDPYESFNWFTFGYFATSAALFLIGAYVFWVISKKAFEKEAQRQINEQNLLYAAIAHDLKTPMTSVQGFSKALSEGRIKPEETAEIYDIIYKKSNSMNELVDTLFDYAKLGAKASLETKERLDICVLIRDLIAENYCDFEAHDIELDVNIPDEPIYVLGDKKELRRAFSNLLINMYKHNPDGIRAYVEVEALNDKCRVKLADSGREIPAGMNVFEPFVTENTARTIGGGSGLGLAITKRILDNHNASVVIDRELENFTKAFVVEVSVIR